MAFQNTTQGQSWTDNSYVVALFQVLMGFGIVWIIRSTCQLVGHIRNRASTDNRPVSTPNIGGSADIELSELDDQEGHGDDLEAGLVANQSISLPQRVHLPQEHGHQEHVDDRTNIGGVTGFELGELNDQEGHGDDLEAGLVANQSISLPRRVYLPQEHGHGQRAAHEDLAPALGGQHV